MKQHYELQYVHSRKKPGVDFILPKKLSVLELRRLFLKEALPQFRKYCFWGKEIIINIWSESRHFGITTYPGIPDQISSDPTYSLFWGINKIYKKDLRKNAIITPIPQEKDIIQFLTDGHSGVRKFARSLIGK